MSRKSRMHSARQTENRNVEAKQRRRWILGLVIVLAVVLLGAGVLLQQGRGGLENEGAEVIATHNAVIEIADYGTVTAELYGSIAPKTVENFAALANEGFYDGLTFHRIIEGFMMQGGCSEGTGRGGSGKNIRGEFRNNGWANPISHERGALSMARSQEYDSASSQFFIMHDAGVHLDGDYAAFGRVLEGMAVVDAVCAGTPVQDWNGAVAREDQPVITSIRVTEITSNENGTEE